MALRTRYVLALSCALLVSQRSYSQTPAAGDKKAPPAPPPPAKAAVAPAPAASATAPTASAAAPVAAPSGEEGWCKAGTCRKCDPNNYDGDLAERSRLTGDWGGARSELADKGIKVDVFSTQFYQGVVSGGRDTDFEYANKFDYLLNIDGCKLGLMKGAFLRLHGETKLGDTVNAIDGLLLPSNVALQFPKADGNFTALTAFKYTQFVNDDVAVFAGKINTLDEYPAKWSPGLEGNLPGLAGFMNTSLVFNPIVARTIQYSTFGVGTVVHSDGKPVFSLTFFDPEDRTAVGFEDLYARGVVIATDVQIHTCLMDKPGVIDLGAVYSTADYRATDQASYLSRIPLRQLRNAGVAGPVESGSWALYANHYQALWVDPCNANRNWGLFGQYGVSDGQANPVKFVANVGIGGRAPIRCRNLDTFGLGYFYTGLSDDFKALAVVVLPQQDEHGFEAFYNYAVTPWCRLTGDVQVARPSTVGADTTVGTGMRLQILF